MSPSWMQDDMKIVFVARLFMSSARALAGVTTPVYLALLGFSAFKLGLFFVCVALGSALISSAVGLLSDRIGRRPFLIALPLAAGFAAVLFSATSDTTLLFVAASVGTFGRGAGAGAGAVGPYQPAESALVTELCAPHDRNSVFTSLAVVSSLGAVLGGLLALLAGGGHPSPAQALTLFRPAFLVAAALSIVAGVIALWIKEPAHTPREVGEKRRVRFPVRSRALLYRLWITNSVNGVAIGMIGPFIAYWFYRRFDASAGEIGVLFAVINLTTAFTTLSASSFARRFGLVRTVTFVRTIQALLLVPMALAPTFETAGALYLLRMIVQRVGMPLRQSYVLAIADPEERASVTALSNLPSQFAMAASPTLTGLLFDEVSLSLPFELAAALQLCNTTLFWGFFHRILPEEEDPDYEPVDEDPD